MALIIGGGAGFLDRRGSGAPDSGPSNLTPSTRPSSTSTTPPITSAPPTTTPAADLVASLDTAAIEGLDPGVAEVGRRYLTSHPDEADLATLMSELPRPSDNPIEAAAAAVSDEFGRGNTVTVDGWVLAESEARAAAVVALVCGAPGTAGGAATC